ncbi:MAG: HlyD family efflux transporter periplasmic adaptor subunit [Gemmatimonadota bacterium]
MDIIRDTKPQKKRKKIIWSLGAIVLLGLTIFVPRLLPTAAPTVDGNVVWRDTVEFGTLIRQVRGPGTLVPEQRRFITAVTPGRIEQIISLPGTPVQAGDVIMRMSNPDVDMQLLQAQQQLSEARAQLAQLRTNLQTGELTQRGTVATVRTQFLDAKRNYDTNQRLFDENPDLVAMADLERSRESMEELELRLQIEEDRLRVMETTAGVQILAQEEQINRLEEMVQFNRDRLESMDVTVPVTGVLAPTELALQEGQWVQSGQTLSLVVVPGRLKAEVRITQTQAQDIVIGQTALIDTRSDTISGQVVRIDPAVRNGTVTIDVALPPDLPSSARPDLSVDGNVIIERLDEVTFVGRPTFGQANSRVSIFRVTEDGQYAERVNVQLGASSVNHIEVREGLREGDIVLLNDMSRWDGFDRVRISN